MRKPNVKSQVVLPSEIQLWPIDRLVPYDRNPRTHSPDQISRIGASIVEFGFTSPILVDSESGVVAGHGRLEAAKQLGLPEVPVIELSHLTTEQKRAYVIADNKLAMDAGWDDRILQEELEALDVAGFNLDLTGFGSTELSVLLGGGPEFIGGEGIQPGVARENNNLNLLREGAKPDSDKAMAGFWFRDVQVSVPMGIYERFERIVESGEFADKREAVVRILEAGMNHVESLSR